MSILYSGFNFGIIIRNYTNPKSIAENFGEVLQRNCALMN